MIKKLTKSEIAGPLIVFVLFFLIASVSTPKFLSFSNLKNQIMQICVTAFLAIGATLVIITGGIDIACGASVALQTMIFAAAIKFLGLPLWGAMLLVLICAIVMGMLNGVLVSYAMIPPFIATLATQGIFRGISYMINKGSALNKLSDLAEKLFYTTLGGIPITLIYIIVFYGAAFYFLKYTQLGRQIYAVGGNSSAAKLTGINVKKVLLLTYTIAGFFTGLAAILYVCRMNSGSQNFGPGMEMTAIAAAVIGGTSMTGGRGNVISTFIGAATVLIVQNVLNLNSISTSVQQIANGIMIIFAVALDIWRPQIVSLINRKQK